MNIIRVILNLYLQEQIIQHYLKLLNHIQRVNILFLIMLQIFPIGAFLMQIFHLFNFTTIFHGLEVVHFLIART